MEIPMFAHTCASWSLYQLNLFKIFLSSDSRVKRRTNMNFLDPLSWRLNISFIRLVRWSNFLGNVISYGFLWCNPKESRFLTRSRSRVFFSFTVGRHYKTSMLRGNRSWIHEIRRCSRLGPLGFCSQIILDGQMDYDNDINVGEDEIDFQGWQALSIRCLSELYTHLYLLFIIQLYRNL